MKKNKKQPYIDYDTAVYLTRIYDFINRANQMHEEMFRQSDYLHRYLELAQGQILQMQKMFTPVDDPNTGIGKFENCVNALRTIAWEAGLTSTLFEKLKDQKLRNRFTGFGAPVLKKEEIEDVYEDSE